MLALHTWENLAEKVHFLLEVSMRELLMCRLHKVLARVEEILKNKEKAMHHIFGCSNLMLKFIQKVSNLNGVEATVLPGKFQQRHQCL